ncbi:MAG: CBS domain-containing protein [Lewinellaceae bacterium]|nr:CBS domain-containing protein [Lewinellaceae bacterium]
MHVRTKIPVKQVMTEKGINVVWTVTPETMVIEALMLMEEKNIGAVVVMKGNSIIGIFSEREYSRQGIIKGRKAKSTPVTEVMNSDLAIVHPEEDVNECMGLFLTKKTRYLPVVQDDEIIGLISMGDVVSSMIKNQRDHIEFLESYITRH